MDPLTDDGLAFIETAARGFDKWASGLGGLRWSSCLLRENGPLVADAVVAILDAILEIGEAAAPLGGPVLRGITAVA